LVQCLFGGMTSFAYFCQSVLEDDSVMKDNKRAIMCVPAVLDRRADVIQMSRLLSTIDKAFLSNRAVVIMSGEPKTFAKRIKDGTAFTGINPEYITKLEEGKGVMTVLHLPREGDDNE